ncbi:helix-turn-helix transcriptional regulator [Lactobacillus sp. 3B(2020)]|uniref:helix-turn-helix domain-containing protein n=1 Tax=Lactobacillus sp. 3B(2020) TaxID=2695882 RepID=UPI0015E03089|nr:helix-turn-helix transcriptional regulator [Lactobacillus sp. 3B(2020)]QLL69773.1 helix-turn-helix domain-containing protein [Lactobacillus sp. 3B(2020)]
MNRIKQLRQERGLTLQRVADELRVGNNTISRYETGKREPKLSTWKKLADFFGVSIPYLQGIESKKCNLCREPFHQVAFEPTSKMKILYLNCEYWLVIETDSIFVKGGLLAPISNCPWCGRKLNEE